MKHYILPAILTLTAMMSGCMTENTDDCPDESNLTLHFKYEGSDTRAISDIMDFVGVYLFDTDEMFIQSVMVTASQLRQFEGVNLTVDPGEYNIICWSNIGFDVSTYRSNLPGVSLNGEAAYYAPKQYNSDPYDNYYESFSVAVPAKGAAEETIEFMQAHRTVSVYVKGMTDTDASGYNLPPVVELTKIPTGYDFHMTLFVETKTMKQVTAYSEAVAGTVFNTPYFKIEDDIEIVVRKQTDNSVLHSVNLQEFLLAEGIAFTIDEPIEIMIEFMDGKVVISLPNWDGDDVKPEF